MSKLLRLPPALEPWRPRFEATVRPYAAITPERALDATVFDSKFGGYPYLPPGTPYPVMDGKPMVLLAQVNWAQVPPMDGYPTSGILQVFVINGAAGDFKDRGRFNDHPAIFLNHGWCDTLPECWRCAWYPDVGTDAVQDFGFLPDDMELYADPCPFTFATRYPAPWLPEGSRGACLRMRFGPGSGPAPENSVEFDTIARTHPGKDGRGCRAWTLFEALAGGGAEALATDYATLMPHRGDRIGGHPHFNQDDPRTNGTPDPSDDPLQHLLQIDTDTDGDTPGDIGWADEAGTAHLFIRWSALQRRDFAALQFYWDPA